MPTVPELVALAVTRIPGVTGHPVPPTTPMALDCWTRWAGYPAPDQYADSAVDVGPADWDVVIAMPSTTATGTYEALAVVEAVMAAVSPLGALGAVTPTGTILADGRTLPTVTIRLTSGG